MNTIWSGCIQGTNTLYYSRKLRFDDMFKAQYKTLFRLDENAPLRILEIGCGPGALAGALRRWYPRAEITGLDRDSAFIEFARAHEPGVAFIEGDATALPFPDGAFDVTISNTVSEHIEPGPFYGEQKRVLKEGGVCLVLSSRRGVNIQAPCLAPGDEENRFWEKLAPYDDTMQKYAVCRYPMNEAELPAAMGKHGFHGVSTGYAVANLTPDDPAYPPELARAMIDADRLGELDAVESARRTLPEHVTDDESAAMKRRVNARYAARLALYERGEKQWDTSVSIIMTVRGVK